MTEQKKWVRKQWRSLSAEDVSDVITELQTLLTEAPEQGWQKLTLEIGDSGDSWYEGSPCIYVFGERLETDKEFTDRLDREKDMERYQKEQYEILKNRYG